MNRIENIDFCIRYLLEQNGVQAEIPDTLQEKQQLADCYRNCLRLAIENGCRSIAFCCISTGEFCFPNRRAAEIAVETIRQSDNRTIRVLFNVFKDIDYDIYSQLLGKD